MSLSLQEPLLAKRRAFNFPFTKSSTQLLLQALFSYLSQFKGNQNLQVVEFDHLTGSDTVIADAACTIYGILLKKTTTTAAYFKGSDHASASSSTAPEIELRQNTAKEDFLMFPDGLPMANGLTISSDTTSDGITGSSAGDGAKGMVILGQ